ncbi:hypothetical protein G7051_17905 [Dysgonomonas sp. HDW5B]|uniref:hypothetical protein n=1 Tax=Dysgonomonas sp. HDW5B TaxID=2714927 RepID=UPI001408BF82|nr:hypothetical protein [Dysgonomonas sp. HDW5B]QIK56132.1 hypothetical protein G7051_17905 [Dysgonomonas sp. HDW5B]
MEFKIGEYVMFKDASKYKNTRNSRTLAKVNVFKVENSLNGIYKLSDIAEEIPSTEIKGIPINRVDDLSIFYVLPIQRAPVLADSTSEKPLIDFSRSYYYDYLKDVVAESGKTYAELVSENDIKEVHEFQRILKVGHLTIQPL